MMYLCFFLSQEDMQLQKKNKTLQFLEYVNLEYNSLIAQVSLKTTDIDIQFCSCRCAKVNF